MARRNTMGVTAVWGVWLAALPVMFLVSCGSGTKSATPEPAPPKAPDARTESKEGYAQEASGAASCITIDIGKHEFLGDLDFDPATGSAVLVVNSHTTGKPYPHAQAGAMLNVVMESGTAQVPLVADPAPGDPEGKTSRYKATAPELKGLKSLKGRATLTLDGKAYLCDLESSH